MSNPAFDYLRSFRNVSQETEDLVIRKIRSRYPELTLESKSLSALRTESCGDYGEFLFA
jgi:hypothetical protein